MLAVATAGGEGKGVPAPRSCSQSEEPTLTVMVSGGGASGWRFDLEEVTKADRRGQKALLLAALPQLFSVQNNPVPERHIWGRPMLIPFRVCLKTRARPGHREPDSSSLATLLPSGQGLLRSRSLAQPLATTSALWLAGRRKDKERRALLSVR
ncbi:unnamed protein product [Rangifer tarandus platyrhynchus]|uniref:Uncharacterized protein n=1 Tax=Rangifer tarandus platyrhynchus TaxID=3082113 RepID=A0ABN8ZA32_RANTA|nr:unnamed protein product [Rangifer tarandus platyrhynchus]